MTWRSVTATPEWRAAMESESRESDSWIEMIDAYDQQVVIVPADAATVSVDGASTENRKIEFDVTEALIPLLSSDPLDPRANLRIRAWWRENLSTGWADVLLGTWYPVDPLLTDNGIVTTKMTGRDALWEAKRGGYRGQSIKIGGKTCDDALRRLFDVVAPTISVTVASTDEKLPAKYTLGARKPEEDWAEIAGIAGFVVWADREGGIQIGPEPASSHAVASWSDGSRCSIETAERELRTSDMRNRIVVVSTHPKVKKPIVGIAEDTDEGSPTYIGLGRIWEERIESDTVTTVTAARKLANVELSKRLRPIDYAKVTIPGRPDVDPGDLCLINRARSGFAGDYRAESWSLPLPRAGVDPEKMQIAMKARPRIADVEE